MSKEQETAPASAPITVGSTVRFRGFDATVSRIVADDVIDLIFYESGKPRISTGIHRGWGLDDFLTWAEYESGRPRSPTEEVIDAAREGRLSPVVGARVVIGDPVGEMGWVQTIRTRGVVLSFESMHVATIGVLAPEPPDDPMEEDRVLRTVRSARHHSTAENKIGLQGFPDCWAYPGEGSVIGLERTLKTDIFPPFRCGRGGCGAGCTRPARIYYQEPLFLAGVFLTPSVPLCPKCTAALADFMAGGLPEASITVNGLPIAGGPHEFAASLAAAS